MTVKNNSTANDADIILSSYNGGAGQFWKIEETSNGRYKISPACGISDNRVLCVNDALFGATGNGLDIKSRTYTNDSNYKDEWILEAVPYTFYGITNTGHDHQSALNNVITSLNSDGYSVNPVLKTGAISPSVSKKDLKESALFTIRCHGQVVLYANSTLAAATAIALNDSTYQTIGFYSDIWNSSMTSEEYICSTDNFSQLDLALLIGCETSYGTTNNLPFQIVNHGAKTAVGFSENILCSNANKWTEDFYFYLSMGYTVQESVAYAKSKSTAESGLKSAQIDGDSSYILIPWG